MDKNEMGTPKSIGHWWESKTYDWVSIQELPFDLRAEEFVWSEWVKPTAKNLKRQRWFQKEHYMSDKKCGQ